MHGTTRCRSAHRPLLSRPLLPPSTLAPARFGSPPPNTRPRALRRSVPVSQRTQPRCPRRASLSVLDTTVSCHRMFVDLPTSRTSTQEAGSAEEAPSARDETEPRRSPSARGAGRRAATGRSEKDRGDGETQDDAGETMGAGRRATEENEAMRQNQCDSSRTDVATQPHSPRRKKKKKKRGAGGARPRQWQGDTVPRAKVAAREAVGTQMAQMHPAWTLGKKSPRRGAHRGSWIREIRGTRRQCEPGSLVSRRTARAREARSCGAECTPAPPFPCPGPSPTTAPPAPPRPPSPASLSKPPPGQLALPAAPSPVRLRATFPLFPLSAPPRLGSIRPLAARAALARATARGGRPRGRNALEAACVHVAKASSLGSLVPCLNVSSGRPPNRPIAAGAARDGRRFFFFWSSFRRRRRPRPEKRTLKLDKTEGAIRDKGVACRDAALRNRAARRRPPRSSCTRRLSFMSAGPRVLSMAFEKSLFIVSCIVSKAPSSGTCLFLCSCCASWSFFFGAVLPLPRRTASGLAVRRTVSSGLARRV